MPKRHIFDNTKSEASLDFVLSNILAAYIETNSITGQLLLSYYDIFITKANQLPLCRSTAEMLMLLRFIEVYLANFQ